MDQQPDLWINSWIFGSITGFILCSLEYLKKSVHQQTIVNKIAAAYVPTLDQRRHKFYLLSAPTSIKTIRNSRWNNLQNSKIYQIVGRKKSPVHFPTPDARVTQWTHMGGRSVSVHTNSKKSANSHKTICEILPKSDGMSRATPFAQLPTVCAMPSCPCSARWSLARLSYQPGPSSLPRLSHRPRYHCSGVQMRHQLPGTAAQISLKQYFSPHGNMKWLIIPNGSTQPWLTKKNNKIYRVVEI